MLNLGTYSQPMGIVHIAHFLKSFLVKVSKVSNWRPETNRHVSQPSLVRGK